MEQCRTNCFMRNFCLSMFLIWCYDPYASKMNQICSALVTCTRNIEALQRHENTFQIRKEYRSVVRWCIIFWKSSFLESVNFITFSTVDRGAGYGVHIKKLVTLIQSSQDTKFHNIDFVIDFLQELVHMIGLIFLPMHFEGHTTFIHTFRRTQCLKSTLSFTIHISWKFDNNNSLYKCKSIQQALRKSEVQILQLV